MRRRFAAWALALFLCGTALPGAAEGVPVPETDREALLSALFEAEIAEVREAIDLGLITCEELTAYHLERIEAYNETYNCFITLCGDALDVARQRDEQLAAGEGGGALFGIPVVVKDNIRYAGYPTTNGEAGRLGVVSTESAEIVEYLLAEGAVILGKTNMSTGAQDARVSLSSAAGETKNAYSPYLASGGSSGGSAVAVSLNFAMAGLGTDTNSSLRYPAALNGCVSLRPTLGTLSTEGCIVLNPFRDTPGVITRTVRDQAIMLDVLSGGGTSYAEHLDGTALEGLRIGVLKELSYANSSAWNRSERYLDEEVAAAFANALAELEACGAEVVEVSVPQLFSLSSTDDSSAVKERFYALYQELLEENGVSALVFPTYLSTPMWSGLDGDGVDWSVDSQTYTNNCSYIAPFIGVPEISVPIGYHSRGAGIGMEIVGDRDDDQLLLNIAYSYTEQYDHREAPSGAADLYADAGAGDLKTLISAYLDARDAQELQKAQDEATPAVTEAPAEETPAPEEPEENGQSTAWLWALPVAAAAAVAGAVVYQKRAAAPEEEREKAAVGPEKKEEN